MKALLLLLVSGVLSAGVFIAGKHAGNESLPPLLILFWQMSGGALVVWLVACRWREFPTWDSEHIRYYLVGGLLGISLPYVLAFIVLRELQVGLVGLVTALSPVVTYAIARLLGHEQKNGLRLFGLITGLMGVALLVTASENPAGVDLTLSDNSHFILLALAIPVSLASSNIYRSKYWPVGSKALPLVTGMLTMQGVWLFAVNLMLGNLQPLIPAQTDLLWLLLVLALLAGASYLSSFSLLKVGGPVYLSQVGYVITAVTLLAGIVFWDEQYQSSQLLSMGLILSGVLLTTWTRLNKSHKVTE